MKRKFSHQILLALGLALHTMLSSCSDEWLEVFPKDMIVYEDFWKTKAQLESAVSGCYMACLTESESYSVAGQMLLWGELRGDNITAGPSVSDDESKIMSFNILPSNAICNWKRFYTVINNCNVVLENARFVMDSDKSLSIRDVEAYQAEALALRSLMYFYLVRTFKEVPLVLEASTNSEQDFYTPKTTEDSVLTQIVGDLEKAYTMAMSTHDRLEYDKGRFTKTSIAALLADVYLWKEDYENCIRCCDIVLSNKELVMTKDRTGTGMIWRQNIFVYGNSNESILEFQYGNSNQGIVNNALFRSFGSSSRNPHFNVPLDITSWDLNSIFGKKDFRAQMSYTKESGASSGKSTKFQESESSGANWIVYRLPEIYLMKAEALVQLDFETNKQQALQLVNTVYMRAQTTPTIDDSLQMAVYDEKMLMDDLILAERQRELMFEGKRWFDIMRAARREKTMRVFSKYILPNVEGSYYELASAKLTKEWARYFPVPLSEMESNSLLTQNPFYETLLDK